MASGSLPGHLAWVAGTHHLRLGLATRVFRNAEGADSGVVRVSIRALGRHWPGFSKHSIASAVALSAAAALIPPLSAYLRAQRW